MNQSSIPVKLRPFPFPYRAALAICSDIDECDRRTFLEVHRYVNDPVDGLGLPTADSFFAVGREPGQMAYFLADGKTPGPDAELIIEAIKGGLIDSIHSWGDFNVNPPEPSLLRETAHRLTEDFCRQGLEIKVWINHGDPNNKQNLKARLQSSYEGDDPCSRFYTGDLVRRLGIKYYWWSDLVSWPVSCQRPWVSFSACLRPGLNRVKNFAKLMMGRLERIRTPHQLSELAHTVTLKDGSDLLAFNRHLRGFKEPTSRHTLRHTLDGKVLDSLMAHEGYLILYTHLGMPREGQGELFHPRDRKAMRRLAEHFHDGRIWVAPTIRVLNYWLAVNHLVWNADQQQDRLLINLESIHDPTTGPRPPEVDELAGLCFYVHPSQETVFCLSGRELIPKIYGYDHTGGWVVGLDPKRPPNLGLLKRFR